MTATLSAVRSALDPIELIEMSRFMADEVAEGRYPYLDFDPDHRYTQRLYRDRRVDIWMIGWLPAQGTRLHDHGGSAGSFTVVSGQLSEAVVNPRSGRVVDRIRVANESVGFGGAHVHDVRNLSDAPAVSVHAYSPPLTSMTYYDLRRGQLRPSGTHWTDNPESEPPAGVRAS